MALDLITQRLAALEAFRGLTPTQLEQIAGLTDRLIFRDGQKLIEAGVEGDGAILMVAGAATVEADAERGTDRRSLGAGTLFGELAMLSEHVFAVTAVADGDVKAVKIPRTALLDLFGAEPEIAAHFRQRLASRLMRVALELKVIDERLAAVAAHFAPSASEEPDLAEVG
jgi:CRP-like cAMP-binding protein